jgi:hypothetical protein
MSRSIHGKRPTWQRPIALLILLGALGLATSNLVGVPAARQGLASVSRIPAQLADWCYTSPQCSPYRLMSDSSSVV